MLKEQTERVLKTVVSPEMHRRVRVRAAEQDVSVAAYVAAAVEERLVGEDAGRAAGKGNVERSKG